MSQTKKNYIYNLMYQLLLLFLPLITAPYISRVLGAENTGIYSYTYSIAHYYVLFAMLGINNYGNRLIAKVRDDQAKLNKTFSSLLLFHIMLSTLIITLYIVYCIFIAKQNRIIALIQIMYVVSAAFDINWFFFGIEKFKLTVTRNTIIKLASIVSLFVFVKTRNDLVKYTIIMSGATLISQVAIWPFLKKYVKIQKTSIVDALKHIKPCSVLFIPVIAISLYNIMDKIMIGKQNTMIELGYYENAEKMISIPLSIITALGTIMLPKMSNLVAKKEHVKLKQYIYKSFDYVLFSSSALCFGLLGISEKFIPLYLGIEFKKTALIIEILCITIIFKAFANVIRTQYLIPNEKDKEYIVSVILGAIVNLIINFILIPKYAAIGAAIATVIAEFVVMLYQIISVKNELEVFKPLKKGIIYTISGAIMAAFVFIAGEMLNKGIITIIIQIIIGICIYSLTGGLIYLKRNKDILKKLPIIKKLCH